MSDPIILALIFGLLVGICVLLLVAIAALGNAGIRLQRIEGLILDLDIRPATDVELAAAALSRVDPARPWREILDQARRAP